MGRIIIFDSVYISKQQIKFFRNEFFLCYVWLQFEYTLWIKWKYVEKKISAVNKKIKQLHKIQKKLIQWWVYVVKLQIKYYNQKHIFKKFNFDDLIMLFVQNIKQKKTFKKLFHKFIESFHVFKIIDKQTYWLILFTKYKIYSVFHVFYL